MSGEMLRGLKKTVAAAGIVLVSGGSSMAIQLFTGGAVNSGQTGQAEAQVQQKQGPGKPQAGGDIWIPGLGVVGKMPSFDFGLEMLYGLGGDGSESTPDRSDFEAQDPDFAIKGTLKKKF